MEEHDAGLCCTCRYHKGGWQSCECEICKTTFHNERCIEDHWIFCMFYKEK